MSLEFFNGFLKYHYGFYVIGLLLLDLIGAYLVHFVEHKTKFLWRFHLIHHTDTWVDTTSANRHHPGESIIRFTFTTLGVLIVGSPMWMVFLYQTLSVIATQFNHAHCITKKVGHYYELFNCITRHA
jgi:sterol desaturase/sphingolipid hydroxylase (fatty acid hydroxylase superfamily)